MKLFEEKKRNDMAPKNHLDDTYDFLDRSGRKFAERIRNELNNWFEHLPEEEKNTIKRRFQTEYESAFFELLLHELFIRLGYKLTIHPEIPESSSRPDFLVENKNLKFYLEATVNRDLSDKEKSKKKIKKKYYDQINKIESSKCF